MSMIFDPTCGQYPRSPGAAGRRTYDFCGPLSRAAKCNQFWAWIGRRFVVQGLMRL